MKTPLDFPEVSTVILFFSLLSSIMLIFITINIWKAIFKEESEVEPRYKKYLYLLAAFTLTIGVISLLTHLLELILISGLLGSRFSVFDLKSSFSDIGIASYFMIFTFLSKYLVNFLSLGGCLLTAIVFTKQFKLWERFSEAPTIRYFFFVGVSMILLYIIQIMTISLQYFIYWDDPSVLMPKEAVPIYLVLFLGAIIVLPVYIYFLAVAGLNIRIPHTSMSTKANKSLIFSIIFFLVWFFSNFINFDRSESRGIEDILVIYFGIFFLIAVYIPISKGFMSHAKRVEDKFLRRNLHFAAIGTLALPIFTIVGPRTLTGMNAILGYLLSFIVLTWSLANISQFLGSREALSRRLKEAGDQFLTELGDADMKAQSVHQMTKVMTDVSNGLLEDLSSMAVRIPPTEDEIKRYIVSTMGVESTPSETEVLTYLESAIRLVSTDKQEV
jgi:hypothetical protein